MFDVILHLALFLGYLIPILFPLYFLAWLWIQCASAPDPTISRPPPRGWDI